MKLTKIKIKNLFGIKEYEADGQSVELSGRNGAGKTSVIDAIRLALTNRSDREYIVRDGDTDGAYLFFDVEDARITFFAHSESSFPSDMIRCLDYMDVLTNDGGTGLDELIGYLESLLDTELINLTPHAITILDKDDNVILTIPSSGIARAEQTRERIGDIGGIPVSKTGYGKVVNLPNPKAGIAYIVSVLTAQAAPDRKDLYIVDEMVRDEGGNIIGCRALAQI